MNQRVTVVLLNWNSGSLGAKAAQSVLAQTHDQVELIVVDNGSTDSSLVEIEATAPEATYLRLDTNRGFATGMNAGIAICDSEFVVPLNCDAALDPDFLRSALAVHEAHPQTAVVGGLVRSSDHLSGPLDLTWTMRVALGEVHATTRCHKADGSCPVMRRAAIREVIESFGRGGRDRGASVASPDGAGVGPYDESYDTYGEDLDLALKFHRLGWEIRFDPGMTAQHVRSFSSARRLADKRGRLRVNNLRNRHRNIIRHAPGLRGVAASITALAQDVGFLGRQLIRGDFQALTDVTIAWRGVAQNLAADLRFRILHRGTAGNLPRYRLWAGKR